MGPSATPVAGLPPLPPGAKLTTPPATGSPSALPPLPPGATLSGAPSRSTTQTQPQPPAQDDKPTWEKVLGPISTGAWKDLVQLPNSVSGLLDSVLSKEPDYRPAGGGPPTLESATNPTFHESHLQDKLKGVENKILPGVNEAPEGMEHVGSVLDQIIQFAYGEGEARKLMEGKSFGEKLLEAGKVSKMLEKYPNLARYAQLLPKMARTAAASGAAGTGVALTHGATPAEAVEQGAVAAGTAGITEGALGSVGVARQNLARFHTAPDVLEARTAELKAARQARAQQQVKDIAKDSVRSSIGRINEARIPTTVATGIPAREGADTISEGLATRNARQNLGSAGATVPGLPRNRIVEELGSQAATIPTRTFDAIEGAPKTVDPNFAPVDAEAAAQDVGDFAQAADKVREAAAPVYQHIDNVTGGDFGRLRLQVKKGYAMGDRSMVMDANQKIDALLANNPGVDAKDYAAAKSAWHDSKILDRLHSVVEGAFNGISEADAAETGIPRELKGGQTQGALQSRLGTFLKNPPKGMDRQNLERVIGPDGVKGLYTASHLTSTPELAKATKELAEAVAKEFPAPMFAKGGEFGHYSATGVGGAVLGHLMGASPYEGASAALATRYVLRQMVMNPAVGDMMRYAVDYGANPQRAAKTIAALITAAQQPDDGGKNPEDTGSKPE